MKGLRNICRCAGDWLRSLWHLERRLFSLLVAMPLHKIHSPLQRLLVYIFQLVYFMVKDMAKNLTNIRTASLTYYTLLSLVPLLAVIFGAAKMLGYIDLLLENLYALFPQSPEIIDYCVDFAERMLARTRGGWMAAVAAGAMLWSAVSLVNELVKAVNEPWRGADDRKLYRYAIYLCVLILFPAFWGVAELTGRYLRELLGLHDSLPYRILARAALTAVELGVFILFYKIVPRAKVRWPSALVAGLTAGTAFLFFHHLLSLLWGLTSYNAIYGSFATLFFLLIWLRWSWQILLTGNELCYVHQNHNLLRDEQRGQPLNEHPS